MKQKVLKLPYEMIPLIKEITTIIIDRRDLIKAMDNLKWQLEGNGQSHLGRRSGAGPPDNIFAA